MQLGRENESPVNLKTFLILYRYVGKVISRFPNIG